MSLGRLPSMQVDEVLGSIFRSNTLLGLCEIKISGAARSVGVIHAIGRTDM